MENNILYNQRHSLAHILAQAVQRTVDAWATLGIGPAIDTGMYYDFLFSEWKKLEEPMLKDITKMMQKICKENQPFHRIELTYEQARQIIEMLWEELKIELIDEFKAEWETVFSYYVNTINEVAKDKLLAGVDPEYIVKYQKITNYLKAIPQFAKVIEWNFVVFLDMCEGPHVESTREIQIDAFALDKIAGAYWRWNSDNIMMTRIYWLVFSSKEELKNYQMMMEEARKRDHKVLWKKFDLFSFSEYWPGFPFFHNNGMIIINELQKYWRETHTRDWYEEIKTPIMLNKSLWEVSGHWWYYKENMYISEIDEQEFAIKPMNCPGGMLVYKTTPKSYRDLPLKAWEFGQVHRHELSWTLNGLFRVRTFTQDDAHIFCTKDQFKQEIKNVIDLIFEMYACFGFEKVNIELSTRPEKYVWDVADRDVAEKNLKEALTEKNIEYKLNEWDWAFYWPKIDFKILDAIWREWQCGTVQLDFALPKRFELEYIWEDWNKYIPIMLHRVVYWSLERFFGILIEHFAGAFPLWLAPTQIQIIPVADKFNDYAAKIKTQMVWAWLRTKIDESDDSFSKKIRNAEIMKVPYIIIVGEKEESDSTVSVRVYKTKEQLTMNIDEFVNEKIKENKERRL